MDEVKSFLVNEAECGLRSDVFLAQKEILPTRSQIRKLFDHKKITINKKVAKPSQILNLNDSITVSLSPLRDTSELLPYNIDLDIVHEDEAIIIVNKPAGLVVHPACGHANDTLVNALVAHNKKLSPSDDAFRPGLVHRIDKDTSGLLVIAKTEVAHSFLAKQFENKTVHRRYQAIVFGTPKKSSDKLSSYLTRSDSDRKKFKSHDVAEGKHAVTNYNLLQSSHHFSLVELRLETGRTHQIRVHLSSIGHPIVGDDTYGGKKRAHNLPSAQLKKYIRDMSRFSLHAIELGFVHPISKEMVYYHKPWPPELSELFALAKLKVETTDE